MGMFTPKPYKKFNRATGKWETVVPQAQQYNTKTGQPAEVIVGKKSSGKK